jgi:dienelactone hydrolase
MFAGDVVGIRVVRVVTFAAAGLIGLAVVAFVAQLSFPRGTGPNPVGRIYLHLTDPNRHEILTDNLDDLRQVPVVVWYPARPGTGAKTGYFQDLGKISESLVASGQVSPFEAFQLRLIRTADRENAQLSDKTGKYPLVILSPGNGINVEFYAGLADDLASNGFVVVGINHPYDVAEAQFADGSIAMFRQGPAEPKERQAWVAQRVAVRAGDILFVKRELARQIGSGGSMLAGRLDMTRVGVMGHSLGGIAAAQACTKDSAIRSCVNLDGLQLGGPFSTSADPEPPSQPFMMITKELKLSTAIMDLFRHMDSGSYRVVVAGAAHASFTDAPVLLPKILPIPRRADRILSIVRRYVLAFFIQTLVGGPSPLLSVPLQSRDLILEVYRPQWRIALSTGMRKF